MIDNAWTAYQVVQLTTSGGIGYAIAGIFTSIAALFFPFA